jgi:hypothetical protein
VGGVVTVLYRPEAPEDAKINSFVILWLAPAILGVMGISGLGMSAIMPLFLR